MAVARFVGWVYEEVFAARAEPEAVLGGVVDLADLTTELGYLAFGGDFAFGAVVDAADDCFAGYGDAEWTQRVALGGDGGVFCERRRGEFCVCGGDVLEVGEVDRVGVWFAPCPDRGDEDACCRRTGFAGLVELDR